MSEIDILGVPENDYVGHGYKAKVRIEGNLHKCQKSKVPCILKFREKIIEKIIFIAS